MKFPLDVFISSTSVIYTVIVITAINVDTRWIHPSALSTTCFERLSQAFFFFFSFPQNNALGRKSPKYTFCNFKQRFQKKKKASMLNLCLWGSDPGDFKLNLSSY